jgi:hypothetical protein
MQGCDAEDTNKVAHWCLCLPCCVLTHVSLCQLPFLAKAKQANVFSCSSVSCAK